MLVDAEKQDNKTFKNKNPLPSRTPHLKGTWVFLYQKIMGKLMNEYLKSQINEHCQMVQRGAKSLSLLPHQERYYDEIVRIINKYKLHYSSEINGEGWRTIYIYKNKALKYLIAELPTKPEKPSEHALLGYLLGYDTNSICDFILRKCKLEEPNLM